MLNVEENPLPLSVLIYLVITGLLIKYKPKIIFADEPTGNLDNKNAKNIFSLLNDLAKINDTVLMVATHDDQLTQMLDKRIAIISGEIKSL